MMHGLRETLGDLSEEIHGYLVHLIGARSVETTQKCFFLGVGYLAEAVASGANVIMLYVTQFLKAAGVDVAMPFNSVTPEAVVYVGQWLLLALIGYWLLSLAFRLVASTLRRVLWLLKLGVVLGLFGWILSDHQAETETTALRLAGLVVVCVLLGIGPSRGNSTEDMEDHVKVLEKRVKDMERMMGKVRDRRP
ncbi:transmembrane protein 109 isoform X2 [Esox lucius]|nr:transmembrane protein 109 isoform X2 [Esox lucius]XP_010889947.1 transmembrane protein 109 isoform X2 [Esox lucius]